MAEIKKSILARVVKSPPSDEQSAKRSAANRQRARTIRRRSLARLVEARRIDWSKRPWFPGRLTRLRPVMVLMLEALDRDAWRTMREVMAAMPAGTKPRTIRAFMTRECQAGHVEARGAFYERVFEKRHCRISCKAYRLTRLGELYLRARQSPEAVKLRGLGSAVLD